jgi:hypothetical protein
MATAQGNTARQDQAVNQQRALAECPLSGQTGHAGMARMTLMTQLPLQLAHSDASRQRKHCGRFQGEADIDCGLQKKKADLLGRVPINAPAELAQRGVMNKRGKPFSAASINSMLAR